jgi:integrase
LVPIPGHPGVYIKGYRFVVVWRNQKSSYRTKTEAFRARARFEADDRRPVERTLFRDYAPTWLDTYTGRTSAPIGENTRTQYRDAIERKAIPFFGKMRLGDIRASDVRKYIDELGQELEPATVRKYVAAVRALFATAREQDLIPTNPAADVRVNVAPKRTDDDLPKFLTPDEFQRLLSKTPEQWRPLVRFVALTGTRIEEALNAVWGDIEREGDRDVLRVRRSKTRAGKRTIPLLRGLAGELKVRQLASAYSSKQDYIWTTRYGTKLESHNLRYKVLKPAARAANIAALEGRGRGFHVLRHTAGSLLLEGGWTLPQVSAFLGHANVGITASVYAHAITQGDIEVLGDALSA